MDNLKFLGYTVLVVLGFLHGSRGDYIASVVEYNFINRTDLSPNQTIEENIQQYVYQIERAKGQNSQIIVFPEYGLTGLITDPINYSIEVPSVNPNTTTYSDYFLNRLASAAAEYQIYVVVNLLEKSKNDNNETIYYNTNVVFGRNGAIVAKYRKINLFLEPALTPGTEAVTFQTDFNVVFGLITCNDIMYYYPSRSILENGTITDVIFPTAWTSYLPFYMSTSVQLGYATANKVNLLAANLNNPSAAMGGSGIYDRNGAILRRYVSGLASTLQLAANIPSQTISRDFGYFGFDFLRNDSLSEVAAYSTKIDFNYNRFVIKPIAFTTQGNFTDTVCDGSFCCTFNIAYYLNETNSSEIYKLMAYNGETPLGEKIVGVTQCNLVACLTDDIASCGQRPNSTLTTKFRNITIAVDNTEYLPQDFFVPSSLTTSLLPVTNTTYREQRTNESLSMTLVTGKVEDNVILFGLYGRSGASTIAFSFVLVTLVMLMLM